MRLITRIWHKLTKLRLRPIKVYVFHHVSEEYDPLLMWKCDWTQIDQFKRNIMHLRESGVEFTSLIEAHEKLKHDWFRCKKYAVLTVDDGYKSLLNILPWLNEQQIPITLFINTKYLDGKSWSSINEEQARRAKPDVDMLREVCPNLYLSRDELLQVASMPNVTIGMHGHEHLDATKQTNEEFKENVQLCNDALLGLPHVIPYFAYTWGEYTAQSNQVLKGMNITPVIVERKANINNTNYIDRIAMDGKNESNI